MLRRAREGRFAYPAFLLSILSLPLLLPLEALTGSRQSRRAAAASRALLGAINSGMTVGLRRSASAKIFRLSPLAAGLFYKYLNILLLSLLWACGLRALKASL